MMGIRGNREFSLKRHFLSHKINLTPRTKNTRAHKTQRAMKRLLSTVLLSSPLVVAASTLQMLTPPSPRRPLAKQRAQKTQLQQLADSFASVELQGIDAKRKDIPMDPLLDACRAMVSVLQRTSPKMVAKDFHNNILKVESQYQATSPDGLTLSSLLRHERDSGVHQDNNLSDPSGAMGLLWIRRSLAFQLDFFDHLSLGNDPRTSAMRAYQAQLQPYHGWALRNANKVILKSHMPNTSSTLLARIGGYEEGDDEYIKIKQEEKTLETLRSLVKTWRPLLNHWKQSFVDLGLEDTRRV